MSTKTLEKKTEKLAREVELLKSFVIGQIGKDLEGEYNPKFVEAILKNISNHKAEHEFTSKKAFLAYLNADKN